MGKKNSYKKKFNQKNHGRQFGNKKFNKSGPKQLKTSNEFRKKSDCNQTETRHWENLKETEVGITEYIVKSDGFQAVIKSRYSDFLVNEIDKDGKEAVLTDLSVPTPPDDALNEEELTTNKEKLATFLPENFWDDLLAVIADKTSTKSVQVDVTSLDKEQRTQIHKTVKQICGARIVSTTESQDDKKFIKCSRAKGTKGEKRSHWTWPHKYVYFILHKENIDTMRATSDLARELRFHPSFVNVAGTKDKRAKTSQWCCVKQRQPQDIVRAAQRCSNIKIGNFVFKEEVLKLGQLKGNRFRIVLRHITGQNEDIEQCLNGMKEYGFINYYGLQRFGVSASVPTFEVGIALLKEDYKLACELILKPRPESNNFLTKAREFWWETRDSTKAAAMIPNQKFIEKKLLSGLAQFGENDYASSLRKIPRNMLLLYIHAYQSLLWNKIASRRVSEYGLKPIVGDLVYNEKYEDSENVILESIDDFGADETEDAVDNGNAGNSEESANQAEKEETSTFKLKVRPITEEEIANEKFSIFDIVLPLPGYDITYPNNDTKNWYDELLAEAGLTSDKLKHRVKTYSLAGAYRRLVIKAENMTWEFKRYESPNSTLVACDCEILKNIKPEENKPDGKHKALILDFSLPLSSYATMALREIFKGDTSPQMQSKLAEEAKQEQQSRMNASNFDEPVNGENNSTENDSEEKVNENEPDVDENGPSVSKKRKLE